MRTLAECFVLCGCGVLLGFVTMLMMFANVNTPLSSTSQTINNISISPESVNVGLIDATRAVVMIRLNGYGSGGSGTIIGRTKVDEDTWRYKILTAHHVIDSILDGIHGATPESNLSAIRSITIGNRDGFHQPIRLFDTALNETDWSVPSQDWAIFSCDIDAKLHFAVLGTREEFNAVLPYENVYGVGADRMRGIFIRDGFISSTNCVEPFHIDPTSKAPWDVNPELFFRPFHIIHFGASGGPIFSKNGKIIGLYNAVGVEQTSPFTVEELKGMAIALKTFTVQEMLSNTNSKITTVEN